MFFGLRDYQLEAARFIQTKPRCAMWLPMGLGKSLISLAAISDNPGQFLPALITGPKRVVRHVWKDEIEKWGFDFSVAIADGTPAQKRKAIAAGADITCISADSLQYAQDGPWKTLVCDEATLFKNHKAKRRELAKAIADRCDNVITLTGSPTAGAGLIDVWGQIDLLFRDGSPLGTFWQFGQRFFRFDHFNRPHAKKGAEERVAELMSSWIFRRDLSEIRMPGLHTDDVVVDMNKLQHDAMVNAELEENGTFVSHRTIASGFQYVHHWSGDVNTEWISDGKMEALSEIRNETGSEPLLVLCNFKAEVDTIAAKFGAAILDGRTSAKEASIVIQGWNEQSLPMLVANATAMSHGLNLQNGGRRIVWFSLPVSQEIYDQAVARLWRSGQQKSVFVHRIIAADSIDQHIAKLLDRKALSQAALMAAVQNQ